MRNLIFVYGTLRRGFHNHYYLDHADYIGLGKTVENFALYYDVVPHVVEKSISQIVGEIYIVNDDDLIAAVNRFVFDSLSE